MGPLMTDTYLFAGQRKTSCCGMLALSVAVVLGDSPNTLSKMSCEDGKEKCPEGGAEMSRFCFLLAGAVLLLAAAAAPRYIVVIVATGLAAENTGFWKLKKKKEKEKVCCSANPLGNSQFSVITVHLSVNAVRMSYQIFACQMSRTGEF